jgi:hypothetical protein
MRAMSENKDDRAKRLAEALRANLRKRKERSAPLDEVFKSPPPPAAPLPDHKA